MGVSINMEVPMGAAKEMAAEVWLYDRTICSGLGDRLGAMLTVATLAHLAGVQVEMEWCDGEKSRDFGDVRTHIPTWVGFNYSLPELEAAFRIPGGVRWVQSFSDTAARRVVWVGNELPAHEALDQVCSSLPKSYITRHALAPFLSLSALLLGAPRLGFAQ